ncbi:MAG: hypothetical protein OXR66_03110 [Candidatus Woesearchaeota archaeon]|nr:hypothetical protein [Candidatus Woesearchaeota archaeon]
MIAKVSKGSVMDQIYIPKKRNGFSIGSHVRIETVDTIYEPYYHNATIEPIKVQLIKELFKCIDRHTDTENIIITGSFLEQGFQFNDIDILIIKEGKAKELQEQINEELSIATHIVTLTKKELTFGANSDPLYAMMLSRYVAKERFSYKKERKFLYKVLDLHLLNSQTLPDSFEFLSGKEKYKLTRNMIAIILFLDKQELTKESIEKKIVDMFNITIEDLQNNIVERSFIRTYKKIYNKTFKELMRGVRREQKQTHQTRRRATRKRRRS